MMPRLGEKYEIEIETTSKPKAEYLTDEYFAFDLPVAPAIMLEEEIIVEGQDIDDHSVEVAICRKLNLPEPAPEKRSMMKKLFSN